MIDKEALNAQWDKQLGEMLKSPKNIRTIEARANPERLMVYYGFAKLTPKIMRKHELVIIYENDNHNPMKNLAWIFRKTHLVYIREQTVEERKGAAASNRTFTKYGYFIDEKPWSSNIDLVLEHNFLSDDKHVPKIERELIRVMLRETYFEVYKTKPLKQLAFLFA